MNPGFCRDLNQRALEQAVKALTLVLQAGNFGLVAFDAADAPSDAIRRLPFTTWLRLQRMVEGSQTTCVLVGGERLARSSAGLTLQLGSDGSGSGIRFKGRMFDGLAVDARVVRSRTRPQEQADVRVSLSTTGLAMKDTRGRESTLEAGNRCERGGARGF